MDDPKPKRPVPAPPDPVTVSSPKSGDTVVSTFAAVGTFTSVSGLAISCSCGGVSGTVTLNHPRPGVWHANFDGVPVGDHKLTATRTGSSSPPASASEEPVKVRGQPEVAITNMLQGASVPNGQRTTVMVKDLTGTELTCQLIPAGGGPPVPVAMTAPIPGLGNEYTGSLTVTTPGVYTFEAVGKSKATTAVVGACRIGEVQIS